MPSQCFHGSDPHHERCKICKLVKAGTKLEGDMHSADAGHLEVWISEGP